MFAKSLLRSCTSLPRSIIIGLMPSSINRKAANKPAGPAPTIIACLLLIHLCIHVDIEELALEFHQYKHPLYVYFYSSRARIYTTLKRT